MTVADAYAVQSALCDLLLADGDRVVGYKLGLTSAPMQQMFGVNEPDYAPVFAGYPLPNVAVFGEQIAVFRELMTAATPDETQQKDIDFLMALGEIFVLVVYAQLVLENARLYAVDDGLVDQIFDCLVRDVSHFALELYGKPATTAAQMEHCLRMIRKPVVDQARYERVWHDHVYALKGAYQMKE